MSDTGAGDDVRFGVEFDVDDADAQREFAQLGARVEAALTKAFASALKTFEREINRTMSNSGTGATRGFRNIDEAAEHLQQTFAQTGRASDLLNEDIAALQRRTEAMRETLQRAGARPELFDVVNAELQKVLRLQAEFNGRVEELANDPDKLRGYEIAFQAARSSIFREVSGINETLRTLSTTQDREGQRANIILKDQLREREQIADRARSEFVVNAQREAAQVLTETRIAGQRRIAAERQFQRTRIELLRFTLQQIRQIERAIGAVFTGTASIAAGAIRRIEGAAQRIGTVFRRGTREMNDGLQPALLTRERLIERSFDRQRSIINQSIVRQSQTIARFERAASTGLTGAVSGRSAIGSLLGGGLAVGGGFLLLDRLKEGFDESVNLNESLNRTRQIFGDASAEIEAFAANSVEALFSTGSAALRAAGDFGIFGRAAGLQGRELADFGISLTTLATDLASFNNTEVDDAVTALAAALRGETEPIRRYGVLLNQAVLQERAFNEQITETNRVLTPAERVLAAYSEILAQTTVAQGDAARTANDFANSSRRAAAASVETAASIAGALVPIAEFFTNFSFVVLPRITDFIEGNVGPGLEILRDALIGAGAALAGLLAARGVTEVLQFLTIALRAVVTPLGLFISGVALIGATFNVLRQNSPQFVRAIETVASVLRGVFVEGIDLAQRGLEFLGEFIDNQVIPTLGRFAGFMSRNLRTALEFGIGFIINVVIPGFRAFGELVDDTILPALEDFGRFLLDRVVPALRFLRDNATEALDTILPLLEPVIDGFTRLGDAIIGAATSAVAGDFSGVIEGLRDFLTSLDPAQIVSAVGIGAIGTAIGGPVGGAIGVAIGLGLGNTLQSLGGTAIDVIQPQLERVLGFIGGFFTRDRMEDAAVGFLELVRRVGEIVGSIVSDPRFVAALEGIALAAVAVGFQFARGFVEGVAENIPALARGLGRQLEFLFEQALEFAFDNPLLFAKILGGVFLSALFINAIRRNMRGVGEQAATGFVGGFTRSVRGLFATNQFATGFFGGTEGLQRAAARTADAASSALARERDRVQRNLARLNPVTPERIFVGSQQGLRVAVTNAGAELKKLTDAYGTVATNGFLLRTQIGEVARGISFAFRGVGDAFAGDLEGGLARIRTGLGTVRTSVGDFFATLRQSFREAGIGLGAAIGGAILSGVGAALSGQQVGRAAAGEGGGFNLGLGLAGVISSALFGAAAVGGGPQGVAVGAAITAIGLASTAVGFFGAQAEEAGRRAEAAAERVRSLRDAIFEAATASEQFEGLTAIFREQLEDLDEFGLRLLTVGEFDLAAFTRNIQAGGDAMSALDASLRGFDSDFLVDLADDGDRGARAVLEFARTIETDMNNALNRGAAFDLFTRNVDAIERGLEGTTTASSDLRDGIVRTADAVERGLGRGLIIVDELGNTFIQAGRAVLNDLEPPLDRVGEALELLERQRLDSLNAQIQTVRDSIGQAREAVDQTLEGIRLLAGGPLLDPLQRAADQLVLSLPSLAESLGEALSDAPRGADFDEAQIRDLLRPFQDQINALFTEAVETFGANLTPEKLDEIFAPIQRSLDNLTVPTEVTLPDGTVEVREVAVGPETAALLRGVLDNLLANETIDGQIGQLALQQATVDQLTSDLEALNAQLPVSVVFDVDQVQGAINELFPGLGLVIDPEALAARQLGAPAVGSNANRNILLGEANSDPEIARLLDEQRAFLANAAARESVGLSRGADAAARQVVIQGDVVGQKVEEQNFQSADTAERTADEVQRSFTARAGSILAGTIF